MHAHTTALQEETEKHEILLEEIEQNIASVGLKSKIAEEHEMWIQKQKDEHNLWAEGARNTVEQNLLAAKRTKRKVAGRTTPTHSRT